MSSPIGAVRMNMLNREYVESCANDGTFWDVFQVRKSLGDGHCILYSVISSMESQHNISLGVHDVTELIKLEVFTNYGQYHEYVDGDRPDELLIRMNDYIDTKIYDSSFGDLVPVILANAMKIDLLILTEFEENYTCDCIPYTRYTAHDKRDVLIVFKKDEHYDGIVRNQCLIPGSIIGLKFR